MPSSRNLPNPGIEPASPVSPAFGSLPVVLPGKPHSHNNQGLLHISFFFFNAKVKVKVSHVRLFTPRTIQSMEFSRPEYWSG